MGDLEYINEDWWGGDEFAGTNEIVATKFQEARNYAQEAWVVAENYLSDLSGTLKNLATDIPTINIDYTPVDISGIIADINSQKPETADLSYSIDEFIPPVLPELENIPAILTDMIAAVEAKFNKRLVEGSTGLDATVEAAIWARARSRQELENAKRYRDVENYYASRGFSIPPGALSGQLNELLIEFARNDSYLNNDIMVEQARLAQANENTTLELATKYVLDRILNNANIIIASNKNKVDNFMAQVEMYKMQVQTELTRLEAVTKVYITQLEAYKTEVQVAGIEIEAKIKPLELAMKQLGITSEIELKEAELNAENIRSIYGMQVEVVKAGAQVTAQLAASAMSSVNASATMGSSVSESKAHNSSIQSSHANDTVHQYIASI